MSVHGKPEKYTPDGIFAMRLAKRLWAHGERALTACRLAARYYRLKGDEDAIAREMATKMRD